MKHIAVILSMFMLGCWIAAGFAFLSPLPDYRFQCDSAAIERKAAGDCDIGTVAYWDHLAAAADFELAADRDDRIRGDMLAVFLILAVYPVPILIALLRRSRPPQFPAFLLVSILLGWTVLGWFAALIWSVWQNKRRDALERGEHDGDLPIVDSPYYHG